MLPAETNWIQRIVVFALIIDLFAFTIPLPLFPRLIDWYTRREKGDALLSTVLRRIHRLRKKVAPHAVQHKWDVVLLGGLMGSLFSSLQFFISPYIGSLSDKYGRKRVLLVSMLGNIISAIVWIQSTSFASFLLARAIGGISEGNVQLSIAILSDITPPSRRSAALMFVGIAFSICFTIGPPIGAYFSTHPFPLSFARDMNIYATPAILTLVLLLIETVFLALFLPETRGTTLVSEGDESARGRYEKLSLGDRRLLLKQLGKLHFSFLTLFSGVEFTLTFLTFDLLDWNNSQNGRLLGLIGISSALLQGGYVRRATSVVGEPTFVYRGMVSCATALIILSMVPHLVQGNAKGKVTQADVRAAVRMLHAAAALLSFTSATVVSSLTALASLQCDDESSPMDDASLPTPSLNRKSVVYTGVATAQLESSDGNLARKRLTAPRAKGKQSQSVVGGYSGKSNTDGSTDLPAINNNVTLVPSSEKISTGRALGEFRSSGQLGRAIGPLMACFAYWTVGPSITYAATALAMCVLVWRANTVTRSLKRVAAQP